MVNDPARTTADTLTTRMIYLALVPAAHALQQAGIRFCLAGSLGGWVYGAGQPQKDLDLLICPDDLVRAADALDAANFKLDAPSPSWQQWFFAAWADGAEFPLEIVFSPALPASEVIGRAHDREVAGHTLPVAELTDILALKLAGLRELHPRGGADRIDMAPLIRIARAGGDLIDWKQLEARTASSPYAFGFLSLAHALGINPDRPEPGTFVPDQYVQDQSRSVSELAEAISEMQVRWPEQNGYERLGREYYDARQHPTCAEFRYASEQLIAAALPSGATPRGAVEVGAGDSLLAGLLTARAGNLDGLLITDQNPGMLRHSSRFGALGATLAACSADQLPVEDRSVRLLVCSLGDPYNTPEFWAEAARVLSGDGEVLFTTPSYQWAQALRSLADHAEMAVEGGGQVTVPSYVLNEHGMRELVADAGLQVRALTGFPRAAFREPVSGALECVGPSDPVIACYQIRRGL